MRATCAAKLECELTVSATSLILTFSIDGDTITSDKYPSFYTGTYDEDKTITWKYGTTWAKQGSRNISSNS